MTWNVSLGFGSGVMFVTPSGGSPLRVGIMQDVSFDISFDQKPLYGQNQWPIALARGKAKGSIKAKTAQIDSGVIGALILGGTPVPNQNVIYDLEAHDRRQSNIMWDCSTKEYQLGGCFFTASSLMSAPQPGLVGMIRWPFSMRGGSVTRSSFQGTSSMSISMIRKFGMAAQKWALISVDMCP